MLPSDNVEKGWSRKSQESCRSTYRLLIRVDVLACWPLFWGCVSHLKSRLWEGSPRIYGPRVSYERGKLLGVVGKARKCVCSSSAALRLRRYFSLRLLFCCDARGRPITSFTSRYRTLSCSKGGVTDATPSTVIILTHPISINMPVYHIGTVHGCHTFTGHH